MAGGIERLRDLLDEQEARIRELRQLAQPGAAPATRGFHVLLNQSMARLDRQHQAFRRMIEELE